MSEQQHSLSGYAEHRARVAREGAASLVCGVLTVSDSRTPDTDVSGRMLCERLTAAGHCLAHYAIVPDEPARIVVAVDALVAQGCAVALLNGGTGIARRDTTIDVLDRLLERRLPGFGELFRMLSFVDIGPAAMLSRATAGVYRGMLIFALPGSPAAVALALERLILPELSHLVWETLRA